MPISRITRIILIISVITVQMIPAQATTYVWITLDPPSSPPIMNSTFTTNLNIASWNGLAGALDLSINYDPAVLQISSFSTPQNSPFYSYSFTDPSTFNSGKTRITAYQINDRETWTTPICIGTLTFKVISQLNVVTNVTISLTSVVDINWNPVEALAYGQYFSIIIPNQKPQASFTYTPQPPNNPTTEDTIYFYDNSIDSDGQIFSWHWDFGDNTNSNTINPVHKYIKPGTYIVSLRVTDNEDESSVTSVKISIKEPPIWSQTWFYPFLLGIIFIFTTLIVIKKGKKHLLMLCGVTVRS